MDKLKPSSSHVPVMAGPRLVEMADPSRVQMLLHGSNARPRIYRHRIVEIQLLDYGDCSRVPAKWGRPQKLCTNLETEENPPTVWTFKRLWGRW
jgi:hypothetical protein